MLNFNLVKNVLIGLILTICAVIVLVFISTIPLYIICSIGDGCFYTSSWSEGVRNAFKFGSFAIFMILSVIFGNIIYYLFNKEDKK